MAWRFLVRCRSWSCLGLMEHRLYVARIPSFASSRGEQAHLERKRQASLARHGALDLKLERSRCRVCVASGHGQMSPRCCRDGRLRPFLKITKPPPRTVHWLFRRRAGIISFPATRSPLSGASWMARTKSRAPSLRSPRLTNPSHKPLQRSLSHYR